MFQEIDLSLVRERNAELLREVNAERLRKRLRTNRELRTGSRRTIGAQFPRRLAFAFAFARLGNDDGERKVAAGGSD